MGKYIVCSYVSAVIIKKKSDTDYVNSVSDFFYI